MRDELSIAGFELAREIKGVRGSGGRWRCPELLRQRVVDFAGRRRTGGMSWEEVARELGVAVSTLRRWVEGGGGGRAGALVPVSVPGVLGVGFPISGRLTLVSPGGYRLEGLDLVSAAKLLEELG